ncbi:hypothetical protein L1887_49897 [Cichorium endivia]|nr:hypothetical protein L1887_49897 [Cichorium endivia]
MHTQHDSSLKPVPQPCCTTPHSEHLIHDQLGIKRCTTLLGPASPARFQIGLGKLCASYAVGRCRRTDTHAVDRPVPIHPRGPTVATATGRWIRVSVQRMLAVAAISASAQTPVGILHRRRTPRPARAKVKRGAGCTADRSGQVGRRSWWGARELAHAAGVRCRRGAKRRPAALGSSANAKRPDAGEALALARDVRGTNRARRAAQGWNHIARRTAVKVPTQRACRCRQLVKLPAIRQRTISRSLNAIAGPMTTRHFAVLDLLLRVAVHLGPDALLALVVALPALVLKQRLRGVAVDGDVHLGRLEAVPPSLLGGEQPGRVDVVGMQIAQRGDPHLDIVAVRVVVLGLLDGVELARGARVVADAGDVLPVAVVGGGVVVDEVRLEELGADAPVVAEILGEEAGDVLTAAVGHEARLAQLEDVGVDKGDAGAALEQTRHLVLGAVLERIPLVPPALLHLLGRLAWIGGALEAAEVVQKVAKLFGHKEKVVAPEQLETHPVRILVLAKLLLVVVERLPDLARRDASVGEEGRHLGAVGVADEVVARLLVAGDGRRVGLAPARRVGRLAPDKVPVEAVERRRLAATQRKGGGGVALLEQCARLEGGRELRVVERGEEEAEDVVEGDLAFLLVLGLERARGEAVDIDLVRDVERIVGGAGHARREGLELGWRRLDGADHVGAERLYLFAERGEDVGRLAALEGKVGRMDEGLAVDELDGDAGALELFHDGVFNVDLGVGHLLLEPDTLHVGAVGLEGADEVGDDVFGDAEADEEVGACGAEARTDVVDGLGDESGAEAAGLPEAVLLCTRLGTLAVVAGQTAELHLSLVKDKDGEEVVCGGAEERLIFELAEVYGLFCGGDDGFGGLVGIVEEGIVVDAEVEAEEADEDAFGRVGVGAGGGGGAAMGAAVRRGAGGSLHEGQTVAKQPERDGGAIRGSKQWRRDEARQLGAVYFDGELSLFVGIARVRDGGTNAGGGEEGKGAFKWRREDVRACKGSRIERDGRVAGCEGGRWVDEWQWACISTSKWQRMPCGRVQKRLRAACEGGREGDECSGRDDGGSRMVKTRQNRMLGARNGELCSRQSQASAAPSHE